MKTNKESRFIWDLGQVQELSYRYAPKLDREGNIPYTTTITMDCKCTTYLLRTIGIGIRVVRLTVYPSMTYICTVTCFGTTTHTT
jgi:hypothetical protein